MARRPRLLTALVLTALLPICFFVWHFGAMLGALLAENLKP